MEVRNQHPAGPRTSLRAPQGPAAQGAAAGAGGQGFLQTVPVEMVAAGLRDFDIFGVGFLVGF